MKKYILETFKYALRSYPFIRKYVKEIESLYAMSEDDLRRWKETRFLEIFKKAFDKSPFYHRLYTEAGIEKEDIQSLDDIRRLPIISKDMVKKHADEILIGARWKVIAANTSGTTGTPLTVYENWPSIWREKAYCYVYRKMSGFTYGQPLVSLRGNLDKSDSYLKVHISNTLYLSSYNISSQNVRLYHDLILKHKPRAIEGYPSSLYSLSVFLRDLGLTLNIPVTYTSSETLLDYQRSLIEKQLGTVIIDLYGMTERTVFLVENNDHKGYYEAPGYSINEFVDDGEICTSLINEAFPLIRYKSYDIVEFTNGYMDNRNIHKILGRKSTYLIGKDGTQYSGALLTRVFKSISTIDYAQFVQKEVGKVALNIVPSPSFSRTDKKNLRCLVIEQLGKTNFDISINNVSVNDLIYSSRGKFEYVVNLIIH